MFPGAGSMGTASFRYRIAAQSDLRHCLELLPAGLPLDLVLRNDLLQVWTRLLGVEARSFAIVEGSLTSRAGPYRSLWPERFRNRCFCRGCVCCDASLFSIVFLSDRVLKGQKIVLSDEELAGANAAEGINVAVLHFGLRNRDLSNPRAVEALMTGSAAFLFFHTGFRVKALITEVYGDQAAKIMQSDGFHLLQDFKKETPSDFVSTRPDNRPYLLGLRRQDVPSGIINPLSQLFYPRVPRLGFSRAERRLLERALLNETDLQIAMSLGVTIHALKKRWASIYARIGRAEPSLMPGDGGYSTLRGEEKRRHVLHHLRLHLEELRPYRPKPVKPSLIGERA